MIKMKTTVYNLFPVPLMEFTDFPITDKEIDKLIDSQDFESMPVNNGLISNEKFLLDKKQNLKLRKNIFKCVDEFTHRVLQMSHNVSYYFQNSWMMKHRPGDWGQSHIHENSLISGILYLRVPPKSGNLSLHRNKIVSNYLNPYINVPIDKPNIFNADNFVVHCEPKKLVLFPANMNHSISLNESEEDRYCIAFNLFLRGILGNDTSVCIIK